MCVADCVRAHQNNYPVKVPVLIGTVHLLLISSVPPNSPFSSGKSSESNTKLRETGCSATRVKMSLQMAPAGATQTVEKRKKRPSPLRSVLAGSSAGAVEIGEFETAKSMRSS